MQDLKQRLIESPPRLPDWLHVDSPSIPQIIESLDYWLNLPNTKTATGMLRAHEPASPSSVNMNILNNPDISPEFRDMLQSGIDGKRQQMGAMLDTLDDAQIAQMGFVEPGAGPAQARALLAEQREAIIDFLIDSEVDGNVAAKTDKEQEWYQIMKTFVPPVELWSRHPGYERFRRFRQVKGKGALSKETRKAVSGVGIYLFSVGISHCLSDEKAHRADLEA